MTANCVFLSVQNCVRRTSSIFLQKTNGNSCAVTFLETMSLLFYTFSSQFSGYKERQKIQYWDTLHTAILDNCKLTSSKKQRPSAGLDTCKIKFFLAKPLRHADSVEMQANPWTCWKK